MGLLLSYNGYDFDTETTVVAPISRRFERDRRGRRDRMVQNFRVRTVIQASTEAAIDTEVNAILTALDDDNRDLTLYQTDGATATPHVIDTSSTLSGTRILGISWPEATGPEYAVQRTMEFTAEATSSVSGKADSLLAFAESVSTVGTGGARYAIVETVEGSPQRYKTAAKTKCRATQQGSATARSGYPSFPDPIWASRELVDRRSQTFSPAYEDRAGELLYTINWSYEFEDTSEFTGYPFTWGA